MYLAEDSDVRRQRGRQLAHLQRVDEALSGGSLSHGKDFAHVEAHVEQRYPVVGRVARTADTPQDSGQILLSLGGGGERRLIGSKTQT
jgi:hypothetical protein